MTSPQACIPTDRSNIRWGMRKGQVHVIYSHLTTFALTIGIFFLNTIVIGKKRTKKLKGVLPCPFYQIFTMICIIMFISSYLITSAFPSIPPFFVMSLLLSLSISYFHPFAFQHLSSYPYRVLPDLYVQFKIFWSAYFISYWPLYFISYE